MLAKAEGLLLSANPDTRTATTPDANGLLTLAKLATGSFADVERALRAEIAQSQTQMLSYQRAFDAMTQGVCVFTADDRVILSNRRFAEIYRLAPEQIRPGSALREIIELRIAAGTWATAADDYLSFCVTNHFGKEEIVWTTELRDGRLIQMRRQPMQGGGCVVTHEDITELKAARVAADERSSMQTLIDRLPDNLWVKDVNSRFVIANQATATRMGIAGPAELIGKNDLELLPLEFAQKFFADEQEIVRTGKPMIDKEEYFLKTWILTTKVPLRNERNEIFGIAGVSRDITERKLADALREGQAQILEMIAMSAPLADVLAHLVLLMESQFKGIIGAVLLLDEKTARLRYGAAPSLPAAYAKAVDGMPVGRQSGLQRRGRLSAGSRRRRRYHDRPAVGGLQGSGGRARDSFMLVDADPVAPGRSSRRIRDVFEGSAPTDRRRAAAYRRCDPHRRHRHRTQTGRRPHSFHGQP